MTTGTKIKMLREKKRLSQEELAHAIGVTQTTIGNWEGGKSIKHEYISKLAEKLDTPIDYLLITQPNVSSQTSAETTSIIPNFEISIKAPNHLFENLNKKIDLLISKFEQNQK
ncbi:helix-turn-helix domain-containing protein [Flavobacterium sp. RSB2_4_14]|uniref:helix-turn-helix domain-containing protein n=1 Tax=Flavobacterium sp. RSB2_4_14 TaxID=3447665 RepID=UPI003F34A432